ncbi:MAG: U32 family peptidase [Lachnospiraceae bacterium]|nr:U32 family peptidase [Lachnospiraceae bacterium]
MKNQVELLAPAGDYEAFLGALNAGADAVYLGGEKFGARAYAQNFTAEEICRAIHTAHFMGRKVYLTVNTLLKDKEFTELYAYLCPFYEAGLDGVIVQDLGVLRYIGKHFKGLALHASTQMAVTGCGGAAFLGGLGVERIVPARELSLDEVRRMKEAAGLEIECFIHGAMCYCYSGQCLFSSILGGRSGNRGRCAQPCRLPYQIFDNAEPIEGITYPLSLKDMCTISFLPQLIEAGIDSFKIEGRMKRPEYAAGVTALYRKYIDQYKKSGADGYRVSKEDLDRLRSLYIRSEIQTGYYERHNGREMITLHKPSYGGSDPMLLEQIGTRYLREPDKHEVRMEVSLKAGEPSCLRIVGSAAADAANGSKNVAAPVMNAPQPQHSAGAVVDATEAVDVTEKEIKVTVYGAVVETARKMPLQHENIKKQLLKTGNCLLTVTACEVITQGEVFMPVSALNDLRRRGVEAYERQFILRKGLIAQRNPLPDTAEIECSIAGTEYIYGDTPAAEKRHTQDKSTHEKRTASVVPKGTIDILVSTYDQLSVAVTFSSRRIYVDSDLYVTQHDRVVSCMRSQNGLQYGLALPYVLRSDDEAYLQRLTQFVTSDFLDFGSSNAVLEREPTGIHDMLISAFLIRNLEELAYVRTLGPSYEMVPDAGLYTFNAESIRFWADYSREYTLPYELNRKEAGELVKYAEKVGMCTAMIVYGTIPMMVTANCIRKTADRCKTDRRNIFSGQLQMQERRNENAHTDMRIRDRYETDFPVKTNCLHCYNVIYNSVPYSLHLQESELNRIGADIRRYDFISESAKDCRQILMGEPFPYKTYTTGHLKRGVE